MQEMSISSHILPTSWRKLGEGTPAPPAICIGSAYTAYTRDLIPQYPYTYLEYQPEQLFILFTQLRRMKVVINPNAKVYTTGRKWREGRM